MNHSVCKLILMLAIVTLLGAIPAIAVEHPFGLSGSGNVDFVVDEGNVVGGTITASGIATHLGPWTQDGDLQFEPHPTEQNVVLASGMSTFTAANGDELYVEVANAQLNTTTGVATGDFVFHGGTGRFEEARGSAAFVVMQDLVIGSFEVTAVGTIDF